MPTGSTGYTEEQLNEIIALQAAALAASISQVGKPLSFSDQGRTISYGSAAEAGMLPGYVADGLRKMREEIAAAEGPFIVRSQMRP